MKHDALHLFGTTSRDGAQHEGILHTRPDADGSGTPTPAPDDAVCTLTVTLRDNRGALGRIAATLSSIPVLALSYAVTAPERATAQIHVPQAHVTRARGRLNRMVDALAVTESPTLLH
ncbi:hypothetical protein ACFWP3_23520 [Streptomyces sp. NPDC058525]|uniref:hypothetical protein n=1 Tax=Streptomyces sp. NPDC058525 TaxID=3346538 RepID=UPI00364C98C1